MTLPQLRPVNSQIGLYDTESLSLTGGKTPDDIPVLSTPVEKTNPISSLKNEIQVSISSKKYLSLLMKTIQL